MIFDTVILAGGSGTRMGCDKLLLCVGEDLLLARAIEPFVNRNDIGKIILVLRKDIFDVGRAIAERYGLSKFLFVKGGDTRSQSVENGLKEVRAEGVLIHDGARPFVTPQLLDRIVLSVQQFGSGIPATPITDSVRMVEDGLICNIAERSKLYTVQTPQGFLTQQIMQAYRMRNGCDFADDSAVFAEFIAPPHVIIGDERNIKVTTLGSYFGLNAKIGIGYDIHRLERFRPLVLGGIQIAYDKGCVAHSDGDAVIHALIDALLSAIGERDIGTLFPDTDPKYKDIDSTVLLSEVVALYRKKNYKVSNVSIIIIADKPKFADYLPLMKIKLGNLLHISATLIGISAKTTEKTREEEAIEAYATAIVT
ncbi:MAG: 2-C-methyl-D-erythritol 2,4-cyclodiphosphate synthase [Clostridia bacterium]|nr:2-C-methyl-D-erythritol 2,4-cyclodiphosphate synthase [Clostridia bacterium]